MTQLTQVEALTEIPLFSTWSSPCVSFQFMSGLVKNYHNEFFIVQQLYTWCLLQNLSVVRKCDLKGSTLGFQLLFQGHIFKRIWKSAVQNCVEIGPWYWHSEVCGVLLKAADGQALVRGWVCLQGGHTRHRSYSPDYV